MRVRLLGPVDVCAGDACRPVSGLRRQALLAVLALARGEVVSTDRLTDVLWGDEPPATARNTLQRHVSHLREVLGHPAAIVARPPGYLLDPAVTDTDVARAERLIHADAADGPARKQELTEALALWRGPALDGLDGLPWLREQADYLRRLHLDGVRALARVRLTLGEHEGLLAQLQALTGQYPYDEQLHAQLILALYRSGRQADALAAYRDLRAQLDDELGIEPGPPLRDLEAAILRQDPALDLVPASPSQPAAAVPPGRPAPLLEREAPLAALHTLAAEARRGAGRLVLVGGEAGVGKTTLLERLEEELPDARWWWGACDGLSTPRPLGPLFDLADQLGGPLLEQTAAGAGRDDLFRALLRQVARPGELNVVVVENIHWADEATLDLLRYLGRRIWQGPILLIASYREEGLPGDDQLRITLGDLGAMRHAQRLALEPLSAPAVGQLAAGSPLAPAELFRLTGGNPFFVTEVLQARVAEVPPSARDAVLARVARLGPGPRELLEVAALTGDQAEVALLKKVTGCPPATLDEVLASGLLAGTGRWVRFRHEIARLAVAEAISAHRSQSVHEQILAALQSAGGADHARLAFHAEAADDGAAVLRYAVAAGHEAAALGAHREAAAQFERALRFAGGVDQRARAQLYRGFAQELQLLDQWQAAADAQERALALWRAVGDQSGEGTALVRLARLRWSLGRGADALATAQRAIAVLEPLGPGVELARAYAVQANLRMLGRDNDAVPGLVEQALELAGRFEATDVSSDALNTLAVSNCDSGLPWVAQLRQSLDLALSGQHQAQAGRAYYNLANQLVDVREFAAAEPYLTDGLVYCDEHDLAVYGTCLLIVRARLLELTGRWDEAVAAGRELLSATVRPVNRIAVLIPLGAILVRQGQAGGWAYLDEAAAVAGSSPEPSVQVYVRAALAEACWLDGRTDDARREAELAGRAFSAFRGAEPWEAGRATAWLRRTGSALAVSELAAEPYRLEFAGDAEGAAAAWARRGCPYDAALALSAATDAGSLRRAAQLARDVGATALAELVSARFSDASAAVQR